MDRSVAGNLSYLPAKRSLTIKQLVVLVIKLGVNRGV